MNSTDIDQIHKLAKAVQQYIVNVVDELDCDTDEKIRAFDFIVDYIQIAFITTFISEGHEEEYLDETKQNIMKIISLGKIAGESKVV